jgi:FKBP-type peptidyl-prolyl cis-trans isomerase FklB
MKYEWIAGGIVVAAAGCFLIAEEAKPGAEPAKDSAKAEAKAGDEKAAAAPSGELKSLKERASYAIGLNIGQSIKKQGIDVDSKLLLRGLEDYLAGGKKLLTDKEVMETMQALQKDVMAKQTERTKTEGEKNAKDGAAFLAENVKKPGIQTTASGLQYKVLTEGTGPKPKDTDKVTVNYRGTLIDGTEFDSSYSRGQPATFPLKGVIPGWTEILQLMPVGSKWQVFIPSKLAYGERSMGDKIGSNSTLIFEIELISIAPPAGATPPGGAPGKGQ